MEHFEGYPLRIVRVSESGHAHELREVWTVVAGTAVLLYASHSTSPAPERLFNSEWNEVDNDSPVYVTPEDGFLFLRSLERRFRGATFFMAYFDRGIRLN